VTRTPRKDKLRKNGNAGVEDKMDTACLTVERLPKMTKRGHPHEILAARRKEGTLDADLKESRRFP